MKHCIQCLYLLLALLLGSGVIHGQTTQIDLRSNWDESRVLENPHKGWFHHLYDEKSYRYPASNTVEAENIPGLQEMFIRVPWTYLEPSNNSYDWTIIDNAINTWSSKGMNFSFQIICCSPWNDQTEYASPPWLWDLGVTFTYHDLGSGHTHYEPDWSNSSFQAQLQEIHQAFVDRYASRSDFAHVEIGSYGDYGEGHTSASSGDRWSVAVVKALIDIYDIYPSNKVHCSEDYCTSNGRPLGEASDLRNYIENKGYTWRDNSILVDWWLDNLPANQYSVAEPDYFQSIYRSRPTFIELEHYQMVIDANNWQGANGSTKGASIVRGAMDIIHPSFMSFHGFVDQWYNDNPQLAAQLANEMGYWYFIGDAGWKTANVPGDNWYFWFEWMNKGVAPAYNQYQLRVRLEGPTTQDFTISNSRNKEWVEGETEWETYNVALPASLPTGTYTFKVKMYDASTSRNVELGFKTSVRDNNGYYTIGSVSF